jgi:hypothetical protein
METSKTCTRCKTDKPLEQFHRYHRGRLGVASECKLCNRIRGAEYNKRTGYRAKEWARTKANDPTFSTKKRQRAQQADPKLAWAWNATNRARMRAKSAGIAFNLTSGYVASIAPDLCPVFNLPLNYPDGSLRKDAYRGPLLLSPSIDRTDPQGGYVVGNVSVICHKANRIKGDASLADIEAVAAWLRSASA